MITGSNRLIILTALKEWVFDLISRWFFFYFVTYPKKFRGNSYGFSFYACFYDLIVNYAARMMVKWLEHDGDLVKLRISYSLLLLQTDNMCSACWAVFRLSSKFWKILRKFGKF